MKKVNSGDFEIELYQSGKFWLWKVSKNHLVHGIGLEPDEERAEKQIRKFVRKDEITI